MLEKKTVIETNILDTAIRACLSQLDKNRNLQLIVYYSREIIAIELNYNIHNKKMLAIVKAFKQ